MIQLLRVLVSIALCSTPLALAILSFLGTPVSIELFVVSIIASLFATGYWWYLTLRFDKLLGHTNVILEALEKDRETAAALVNPVRAYPVPDEPLYQCLLELTERLSRRRHQINDTVNKIGTVLTTLSLGKPLDMDAGEFDLPDPDDRTVLLGSMCQLINSLQQSRQRGDVFATVLRESPIAMLITDPYLKIRSLNPAAEKLLGFSQQKVLHHSLKEFFTTPPPLKNKNKHLNKFVLEGDDALEALRNGKQEVFTTIKAGDGKVHLIGLRASFGQHCLFVIRERSKDKLEVDVQGPDAIHFEANTSPSSQESQLIAGS